MSDKSRSDVERVVICHNCKLPFDRKNIAHVSRGRAFFHNDCFKGIHLVGGKAQARELGGLMVEARSKRIWV